MTDHRTILNSTARTFHATGVLYPIVAERLLERMELMTLTPQRILELGGGTGHLTTLLQKHFSHSVCYVIDVAEERLALISLHEHVHIICADANVLPFENNSVDLVISNLMAHWVPDQKKWLQEAKRVLKVGGLLIFSFFATDTLKEVGAPLKPFYDMHDMGDLLVSAGFSDPVLDAEKFTLEYDAMHDVVDDLNNTAEIALLLPVNNDCAGEINVIYEVVYAHAWKAAEPMTSKIDQDGMVTISLDQIRRRSYT